MGLLSYPMQSDFEGFDEYGNPIFDRAVDSLFFRRFWGKYFTDGVFFQPADGFTVKAEGGTRVSVKLGECHVQGVTSIPDDETVVFFDVPPASPAADRVVRFVIAVDMEDERRARVKYYNDWKPTDALIRNSDMHELAVADIRVRRSATSIQQSDISDLRFDEELCGIVTEPIKRTSTAEFYAQLRAEMARISDEWGAQEQDQQTRFQQQLDRQNDDYTAWSNTIGIWKATIDSWKSLTVTELAQAVSFSFDNQCAIVGTIKETTETDAGVSSVLKFKTLDKILAEQTIEEKDDGSIVLTQKVYETNGDIFRHVKMTITETDDKITSEVVDA